MSDSVQKFNGTFSQTPAGVCLEDVALNGTGWTGGSAVLDSIASQANIITRWTILSWTIAYTPSLVGSPAVPTLATARLGQLFGGVVTNNPTPIPPSTSRSLPGDTTNIAMMWNGTQDDPFRMVNNNSQIPGLPTQTFTQQLPQPIQLQPGERFGMGMWLTPSLSQPMDTAAGGSLGSIATFVWRASYVVTYTTSTS